MSVKNYTSSNFLTYRFDFENEDKLHSVCFTGCLPPGEVKKMLKSLQIHLYQDMADAMQRYLNSRFLEYYGFISTAVPSEHETAMKLADTLLHAASYSNDRSIAKNADIYYGIIDYQRQTTLGYEGCYCALKKILSCSGKSQCYFIGQTFSYRAADGDEQSYFAIRQNHENEFLRDIDKEERFPVLPTFGCVNLLALLMDIESIRTKEEAEKTAGFPFSSAYQAN